MTIPADDRRALNVAIIGASFAGLFAAAAVVAAGGTVTLIERDSLPAQPQARRGVPQSEQSHVLLFRGLVAAEELLPGLRAQLTAAHVPQFRGGQLALLGSEGWAPRGDYGFDLVYLSRPLLEHVVRQRVLSLPGVTLISGARAHHLQREDNRWTIDLRPAGDGQSSVAATDDGPGQTDPATATPAAGEPQATHLVDEDRTSRRSTLTPVRADVVIDASGRGSRMSKWLQDLGVAPAKSSTIDAGVGYATRRYVSTRPPEPGVIMMAGPHRSRGCMVGPIEEGQWLVSAVGVGADRPGRDEAAFTEHLKLLPYPIAHQMVQTMTPLGAVAVHRQTANVRHRYEDVRDWPEGLLVVGDALCAVNPMYGQGIAVSAQQGVALRDSLTRTRGRLLKTRKVQRRLARTANLPWTMATSQDRQFLQGPDRPRPMEALVSGWGTEVARLAMHGDTHAADVMQAVTHLMTSPAALFHPTLIAASVRSRLSRRHQAAAQVFTQAGTPAPVPVPLDVPADDSVNIPVDAAQT